MFEKLAALLPVGFICFCAFFVGQISFMESYFPFAPWIDTKVSKDFDEEKFNSLKVGDSKEILVERIGLPLYIHNSSDTTKKVWYYTDDAKCEWGDFAWFERSVVIDSTDRIVEIRKQIYFD